MSHRVFLSLGSNIRRYHHLNAAVSSLKEAFGDVQLSQVYESEAVGFEGDDFLNMVVALDTDWSVDRLNQWIKSVEDQNGRERNGPRFSPRTLDIDILLFGRQVLTDSGMDIPRAEILTNAFVLRPLAEIAPDDAHPLTGQTFQQLWSEYDQESQKLWPVQVNWSP